MPATGERVDSSLKASSPTDNQWARAFIGIVRGLHAEIAQSVLIVVLRMVIGGLTSIILIVLGSLSSVPALVCSHFLKDNSCLRGLPVFIFSRHISNNDQNMLKTDHLTYYKETFTEGFVIYKQTL